MMTIFSVLDSGSLILPAISGITRMIISMTAASLYCLNDSALTRIASAVALPCASMTAAWARPRALFASASARPVAFTTSAPAKPVALVAEAAPAASVSSWNFLRVGQRLDLVTFGVGGFLHGGFEFALLAQNFLLLQFDLLLLLHDADLDFLGLHQLAGLEFLQIIRQVGLRLLHVHGRLILRDVGLVIALRLGDFRVGQELRLLAGLIRLRGADDGIAISFGLRDDGVAFDLGDARFAQGVEIALRVADVADGEADDAAGPCCPCRRRPLPGPSGRTHRGSGKFPPPSSCRESRANDLPASAWRCS